MHDVKDILSDAWEDVDKNPEVWSAAIMAIGLEFVTMRYAKKHFGKQGTRLVRLLWASEVARRGLRDAMAKHR